MSWVIKTEDARSTLYLLEIEIDDELVQKVGITSKDIGERVATIARSVFAKHRYSPYVKPKRYRKVDKALAMEQKLLKYLDEYKWQSKKDWGRIYRDPKDGPRFVSGCI